MESCEGLENRALVELETVGDKVELVEARGDEVYLPRVMENWTTESKKRGKKTPLG